MNIMTKKIKFDTRTYDIVLVNPEPDKSETVEFEDELLSLCKNKRNIFFCEYLIIKSKVIRFLNDDFNYSLGSLVSSSEPFGAELVSMSLKHENPYVMDVEYNTEYALMPKFIFDSYIEKLEKENNLPFSSWSAGSDSDTPEVDRLLSNMESNESQMEMLGRSITELGNVTSSLSSRLETVEIMRRADIPISDDEMLTFVVNGDDSSDYFVFW